MGRRPACGSAEDEAAARLSWRGGGRRVVAAASAPGSVRRARTHGEANRAARPPAARSPACRSARPGVAWRPGAAPRPPERSFRSGMAGPDPRELGGGISEHSRQPGPCSPAPPLGAGARGSPRSGLWTRETALRGGQHDRRWMHGDPGVCQSGNTHHFTARSGLFPLFLSCPNRI